MTVKIRSSRSPTADAPGPGPGPGLTLADMPVTIFVITMGWGGLGMAWRQASLTLAAPPWIAQGLLLVTMTAFVLLLALYGAKMLRHFPVVRGEFANPQTIHFFGAITISGFEAAAALTPLNLSAAAAVWMLSAGGQLALLLAVMRKWLLEPVTPAMITPIWFVPVVGSIVGPITGTQVGLSDLSWLFFAAGLVFWIILKAIVFYRLLVHEPLAPRAMPTLVVMISPPAIACLGYEALTGQVGDTFSRILFFTAVFIALVLLSVIGRLARAPFSMTWWAYGFPLAAFAAAVQVYARTTPGAIAEGVAALTLAGASAMMVLLTVRSAAALPGGRLFRL